MLDQEYIDGIAATGVQHRPWHIEAKHFYITENVREGLIVVQYLPTGHMIPDMFTKALPWDTVRRHSRSLGVEFPTPQHTCFISVPNKSTYIYTYTYTYTPWLVPLLYLYLRRHSFLTEKEKGPLRWFINNAGQRGEEGYMAINGGRKVEWQSTGGAGGLLFCVITYLCAKRGRWYGLFYVFRWLVEVSGRGHVTRPCWVVDCVTWVVAL